jgi:5-methylcytosine-specific restriction endonuclease McrA
MTIEQKSAKAIYAQAWRKANREHIKLYNAKRRASETPEQKAEHAPRMKAWRKANPEKAKATKRKYYASPKGKLQKRKEDDNFILSGGRAKAELKRALFPISEARKQARFIYGVKKRSGCKNLSELDIFVLQEARLLCKLRETLLGTKWDIDHIIPVSRGGTSVYTNLQVVPSMWNKSKSNRHTECYFGNKGV